MTIEREALAFLIERVRALDKLQRQNWKTLIQLSSALAATPAGAMVDSYSSLADSIVSAHLDPAAELRFDEIIRLLKET